MPDRSRLGRGGGGIGSRMRGQALPFDVDPELVEAADKSFDDDLDDDDSGKDIWPDFGEMVMMAPITDAERRTIQIGREMDAQRRAGPWWTGTKEDWAAIGGLTGKEENTFNPFEDAPTYGNKHGKKPFKLADLTKVKMHKQFFPKELWSTIGYGTDEDDEDDLEGRPAKRQKKVGIATKSAVDKLAKFDDDYEEDTNADADEEDEEGEEGDKEDEEGEEFEREPEDDVFEEDEDDANNDYNAEAYFDGGDEDFEEQGGDEYGEDYGY